MPESCGWAMPEMAGILSNKIPRDELKPGDHIYSWRNAYLYAHHGMAPLNTGLSVELNKGHVVTKKDLAPCPSDLKGKTGKRIHFIRSLTREDTGFAPYEKRLSKLLKISKDKCALVVAKRKLVAQKRAKKKREEMSSVLRKMRATGGGEKTK